MMLNEKISNETQMNHVLEGEKLFGEGRLDEARDMFWAATESCPGNAQAWNNLAVVALTQNKLREAEQYLRQALEVKSDFIEARHNLAECYCLGGQWSKAARELRKTLEIKPEDIPTIKRLAQVYTTMGDVEKAQELLEQSGNMSAMKSFIDSLWLGIKYYAMKDDLSARDKLEKFVATVLKFIDGQDGRSRAYKLVSTDPVTGETIELEGLHDAFYYKEQQSLTLESEQDKPELILTVGDHDDWINFREALRTEMRAEGGCLGDFTQTRKVLKNNGEFTKYDFAATLRYFQDNVGPCDCHVLRAVLI